MRVFFALLFQRELRDKLTEWVNIAKTKSTCGNFTTKANLHLTLEYIGEVNEVQLKVLKNIIRTFSFPRFKTNTLNYTIFHSNQIHPILVLKLSPTQELLRCDFLLKTQLENAGFQIQSTPFTPHVTFARKINMPDLDQYLTKPVESLEVSFEKLSLMESIHLESGMVYREIMSNSFL